MNTMVRTLTPDPVDESTPSITARQITCAEFRQRVRAAHDRIGNVGRFSISIDFDAETECCVTHWFRPDPYAFEDCKAVAAGTLEECLSSIDRYAADFRLPSRSMSAADIGLEAA